MACCPWRALSCKCFMNGRPEDSMPINIEIMTVASYYAMRDRRYQAERANILCGYQAVATEQLCPLDLVFCQGFLSSVWNQPVVVSICCFCLFWGDMSLRPLVSWLYAVPTVPSLNCSSSILVIMGPVVMSWCKISGCSQWYGIHDTLGWVCGDSFTQVRAGNVGQSSPSLPDTGGHLQHIIGVNNTLQSHQISQSALTLRSRYFTDQKGQYERGGWLKNIHRKTRM